MADLLGSILGSMEKPPSLGDVEKKKAKERKLEMEKQRLHEREKINIFRQKIQLRVKEFINDNKSKNYKFEHMEKGSRAIVHEVAEVAGVASFSFGDDEVDRYVMLWKKEYAPCDEELNAYKRGEVWDPEKAKALAKQKETLLSEESQATRSTMDKVVPNADYHKKYERLLGKEAAKDAAKSTRANTSYGFVPSENKRDLRTIEQVMADTRARKKLKTDHEADQTGSIPD